MLAFVVSLVGAAQGDPQVDGKAIYDFYCYQCHAYSGDAETLASSNLEPRPRDFVASDPDDLTKQRMVDSVKNGRPGTAMVSFAGVLGDEDVESVVDFIRIEFMTGDAEPRRYHTRENGWENPQRFAHADAFVTGETSVNTSPEKLSTEQRRGRRLYLNACISCHDRPATDVAEPIWDLRPLSFPRDHYSHRSGHIISGASPYAVHDVSPQYEGLTDSQDRGRVLFEDNCAFCHAADGTGKNWIGRFLEPHASDLTRAWLADADRSVLAATIRDGRPGTSMPAWHDVLTDEAIDDVLDYVTQVLAVRDQPESARRVRNVPPRLVWVRANH